MRLTHTILITIGLAVATFSQPAQADISIIDSLGEQVFQQIPPRVVVLNWDLLEQVLALGITPVGASDLSGYQQWVVNPTAPDAIEDIGTRSEPNLEKIARLKPDVILAASPQKDLISILERIAPVVYLKNFEPQNNAALVAIKHFKTLAILFGKEDLAKQKLQQMEAQFALLRQRIGKRFSTSPDVLAMRFSTLNSVFLYTENSTTQYVIKQLELNNPLPVSGQSWGVTQKRINALQHIVQGYVLYIKPFPNEAKLSTSALWQALPFVQQGHVNSVRSIWSYGGAMSLQYMAEAITDSLLEVAPK